MKTVMLFVLMMLSTTSFVYAQDMSRREKIEILTEFIIKNVPEEKKHAPNGVTQEKYEELIRESLYLGYDTCLSDETLEILIKFFKYGGEKKENKKAQKEVVCAGVTSANHAQKMLVDHLMGIR